MIRERPLSGLLEAAQPYGLVCEEVWGGTQKVGQAIELPGLTSWVYSAPFEQSDRGGDVYYLSVCDRGLITRLALADVSGHGCAVASFSAQLLQLVRDHISTWDQSDLMRELDRAFGGTSTDSMYATAVMLGYYRGLGQLAFTLAGHPRPLWRQAAENRWAFLDHDTDRAAPPLAELPLGAIEGTTYRQTVVDLVPGDLMILYSDCIFESTNPEGEELGLTRLLELARSLPVTSPEVAGRALLSAVGNFRNGKAAEDDETLIVLQRPVDS